MVTHPVTKKDAEEPLEGAVSPRLVLATHNPGKVQEFTDLLAGIWPGEVVGSDALGVPPLRELTLDEGGTFVGNACLKAEAACAATGEWALADDSGLCVEALGGAPGVDTANYGGFKRLLEAMARHEERGAVFVCVLALARPGEETVFFRATCLGAITAESRGDGGFGYDPVFVPDAGDGRTFAEMGEAEKGKISHRAKALGMLREWLESNGSDR